MHRRTTMKVSAAALLAAALTLTACGSDSAGGGAAEDGGLKGTPITIGMMCSCSGPFAANLGGTPDVATAWTKTVNNSGGINGHPVKVVVADDGGDATKSQQMIRKLVEQDKVMAVVDEVASYDASWASYVSGKGVPVLAGVSFTQPMSTNPNFFPTGGTLAAITYGLVQNVQKSGKTKLAVLACAEAPLCAGYTGQISRIAKATGSSVTVAYQSKISATQASYTAQCLAAKSAGADSMYVGHGGTVVTRVVDQCVQQGYQPTQFQVGGDVVGSWEKDRNLDGVPIAQFHLPLHDETTQGGKAFHDALRKYAPGVPTSSNYSEDTLSTWIGLQLFAAAAKAGKIAPTSTGADVKKGLYTLKNETLGGLTPPLNYVAGKPTVTNCYFNESVENGKWTTPGGVKPVCLPADVAAKVNAAFAG
ncbi:amino acid/amide ABC transporter substrate-binding protein, HAAT family [Jatrophihabitans endophyticus]|uniref:Amino acid/amide ABC transporter substrate-binding protein, HAAT family n=1 Tax=Jatrophihabitans endophyticus TaxID=1206085 RepID=A0A1M5PZ87_9ACTN|nr:ABC transporter substrate-binding protein [Jatrophihabitans endophyticus]SHH06513.1 amino acid/amide ABC transporter substrate-binding protein, HAAT family [Jatrophihabitans endophyticus]